MKNTKLLLLVLLLIALTFATMRFWDVLMLFLVSIILSYLLSPAVNLLCRKTKMKRGLAVALVVLMAVVILVGAISLTIPSAITQISSLIREIQHYANNFEQLLEDATVYFESFHLPQPVADTITNLLAQGDKFIASFLSSVLTSIVNLSLKLFDFLIILILTVYFLLDGHKMVRSFLATLPPSARARVEGVMGEADRLTWRYIKSRVLISLGMSVVSYIGFLLIGLPYAPLFAVMTFILDFIPYFGSIIAGVIEAFFALITGSLPMAITVAVFVVVVQQIEGNIVVPKVQGDLTGIHPVTVMFSLLACNKIWGPMGMLISVPIAAILKIIVKEVYLYIVTPDNGPKEDHPCPKS